LVLLSNLPSEGFLKQDTSLSHSLTIVVGGRVAVTGDDAKRLEAIANDDEIQDGDFCKVA